MLIRINNYLRDTRGQSLVEFAVIAPIMVLLLCGAIEFGNLIYTYERTMQAAQQAGLVVARTGSSRTANAVALKYFPDGTTANLDVGVVKPSTTDNLVVVTVTRKIELLTPLFGHHGHLYDVSGSSTVMLQVPWRG